MSVVWVLLQILVSINLWRAADSQEINKYCQLSSKCELKSHIGCTYNTLRSSGYEIEHLKYSDRLSIINQLNQFRSNIAVGNTKFRPEPFPDMKKIVWNYELEKLLKLSIRKVTNEEFSCVLTSQFDQISQFYFIKEKPKGSFTIAATFSDLLSNIIGRTVHNYKTAADDDVVPYSYLFNPETSVVGCAVGSKMHSGDSKLIKSVLLRCAFNGTKIDKNFLKSHIGWQCSECSRNQMKCDQFFPGLCVAGNVKGFKGAKGMSGLFGPPGFKGDNGEMGIKGGKGFNGPTGAKGQKGEVGGKGYTDLTIFKFKGDQGEPGETITGYVGRDGGRGTKGIEGLAGKKGMSGPPGSKGISNHAKGSKGHSGIGTPGDAGNKGLKGDMGEKGSAGIQGAAGAKGKSPLITVAELLENCNSCPKGPRGPEGPPGKPGEKGLPFLYKQN